MFNDISANYDFLNHLLTFGIHSHWRNLLAKHIRLKENKNVLDLATGTGDVLLSLFRHNSGLQFGYGIDLAEKMLEIGRHKIQQNKLSEKIILQTGNANAIPFADQTFDNVTMAFGIRNVENPQLVLSEIHRVLIKDGIGLILECSLPKNKLFRCLHLFYLRTIVPLVGAIFSGHRQAYRYLNKTIESFPYGDDFCQLMRQAGFRNVNARPLLFGVATIYRGER